MFDAALGKLYFRRWSEQSIDALQQAAEGEAESRRPARSLRAGQKIPFCPLLSADGPDAVQAEPVDVTPYEVAASNAWRVVSVCHASSGRSSPVAASPTSRRHAASGSGERHDPGTLPGAQGACELILGHLRARVANCRVR